MNSILEAYSAAKRKTSAVIPTDTDILLCDNTKSDSSNGKSFKVRLVDLVAKLMTLAVSIGYSAGHGGAVTQGTSKATGVTLNKITGAITLNGAALTNGATATFTVTNSTVGANDNILINHKSGGTLGGYTFKVHTIAAGSFKVAVKNDSGGDLSEAPVVQFSVFKGAVA